MQLLCMVRDYNLSHLKLEFPSGLAASRPNPVQNSTMTTEPEMTPRITELHVRMDCNGCEHKIRKTLSAIDGVSEVYMDQANHKITVVGIADLKRIVKAIRKTKRVPTICSHTDPAAEAQPPPPPAEGESPPTTDPPADAPPPAEAPPSETTPEIKEAPPAEPTPENKEAPPAEASANKDATVICTVHENHYGHDDHLCREHWANHPIDMYGAQYDAAPYHVTHSYSHHRPSPYFAEYGYGGSPVQEGRYYSHEYYPARGKEGDVNQITSMFSDENPNACSIS